MKKSNDSQRTRVSFGMSAPNRPENLLGCCREGCAAEIKDHYWGRVKSGWFLQKNGLQYCPEHTPEWVPAWRERRADRAPGDASGAARHTPEEEL